MAKRFYFKVTEGLEELKKLRKKQSSIHKERRILWLIWMKENSSTNREETATSNGISLRTQERWIKKYLSFGVVGLLTDAPNQKKSKIFTTEIHEALAKRVHSSDHPFLGYWDAVDWVGKEYGVDVKYHWLRAYLIKHFKTKLKSPRKSHYKKDEQAVNAFLKTP